MPTAGDGARTPKLDRPISVIAPRSLREHDAATYLGFSSSYLRNQRVADIRSMAKGLPTKGPKWVHIGTAVRYLREDLDAWIDGFRIDPGQGDPNVGSAA